MTAEIRQIEIPFHSGNDSLKVLLRWQKNVNLVTLPAGILPEIFETKIQLGEHESLTLKAQIIGREPEIISITSSGIDLIRYLSDEVTPDQIWSTFRRGIVPEVMKLFGPTGLSSYALWMIEEFGIQPFDSGDSFHRAAAIAQGQLPALGSTRFEQSALKLGATVALATDTHVRKIRARMTPERLKEIATVYTLNIPNGLEAVQEQVRPYGPEHKISRATAARYVRQAREAGLIVDRRRNKSN